MYVEMEYRCKRSQLSNMFLATAICFGRINDAVFLAQVVSHLVLEGIEFNVKDDAPLLSTVSRQIEFLKRSLKDMEYDLGDLLMGFLKRWVLLKVCVFKCQECVSHAKELMGVNLSVCWSCSVYSRSRYQWSSVAFNIRWVPN